MSTRSSYPAATGVDIVLSVEWPVSDVRWFVFFQFLKISSDVNASVWTLADVMKGFDLVVYGGKDSGLRQG